jgi:hypothetical protein
MTFLEILPLFGPKKIGANTDLIIFVLSAMALQMMTKSMINASVTIIKWSCYFDERVRGWALNSLIWTMI